MIESEQHATTPCELTGIRPEVCRCRPCNLDRTIEAKHRANKRDVHALIDLVAGAVDCHSMLLLGGDEPAQADQLALMCCVREYLMTMAIEIACWSIGHDKAPSRVAQRQARREAIAVARRRLELALCVPDEDVGEALIDAMSGAPD